jgi:mRNA interferase MazF
MAYSPGDVVLVPFPYRDMLAEKTRPAVVVSATGHNQRGDLVIAALTTQPPRSASDYGLSDWAAAGLKAPSTARMLLATVAESRVQLLVGRLSDRDRAQVRARLSDVFHWT